MTGETILLAVILIAIYLLFKRIDRIEGRLDIFESKMLGNKYLKTEGVNEKLDNLESLCSPLSLLDVFSGYGSGVSIDVLRTEFEKAEEKRLRLLDEVAEAEKRELQLFEKSNRSEDNFVPSEHLKKKILDASVAIVIAKINRENFQALQQPFIDVLTGKITLKEGLKAVNKKIEPLSYVGSPYEQFHNDPRVQKMYEEFFADCKSKWQNGKWKERLNRLNSLDKLDW